MLRIGNTEIRPEPCELADGSWSTQVMFVTYSETDVYFSPWSGTDTWLTEEEAEMHSLELGLRVFKSQQSEPIQ